MEAIHNPTYGTLGHFKQTTTDNASTLGNTADGTVIANETASTQELTKSDNMEELKDSVSN